jgi:hypothetical protein
VSVSSPFFAVMARAAVGVESVISTDAPSLLETISERFSKSEKAKVPKSRVVLVAGLEEGIKPEAAAAAVHEAAKEVEKSHEERPHCLSLVSTHGGACQHRFSYTRHVLTRPVLQPSLLQRRLP